MIYTAPCVMFLMCADTLRGQVGGGWALDIESFLGPVKWHWADRRVPFWAQKTFAFGRGCLQQPVLHLEGGWAVCFLAFWFCLFVSKRLCLFRLFRYRSETPKQTEKMFLVTRNKQQNNRDRLSFCLFLFQPNIFLVCFKDTLTQGIQTGASLHSYLQ